MLTLGVYYILLYIILYYYIHIHIHILLLYIILSILFSSSFPHLNQSSFLPVLFPSHLYFSLIFSSIPLPLPHSLLLLFFHSPLPIPHLIQSIRVGTSLRLFILSSNNPSQTIYLSIHSIRVGTYITLFIFQTPPKLTPHVLSEWMVEVCGN